MTATDRQTPPRTAAITIRASSQQRDLIDRAARLLGKNRSEFMLDVACREAQDTLLDQRFFVLDPEAYDRFVEMLDNPPPPTDALRELLNRKPAWG